MSDRRIDQLETKPSLLSTDLIVVSESSGATWKATIDKFRNYLFGLIDLVAGPPDRDDSVFFRQFSDGKILRVPLSKLIPNQTVTNDMLQDGNETQGTGISSTKLAPGCVTNSKIVDSAINTRTINDAETSNIDNYPAKVFQSGVTTSKICDGAVTGIKGGVPPGAVFHFASKTAPAGYLVCNGDTISSTLSGATQGVPNWRLQDLRLVLGTTFGADGRLPDLRGIFVRGYGGGETPSGGSHTSYASGGIGRNSKAVAKHFLRSGSGQRTASQIKAEAEAVETDTTAFSYFVVEYTVNAGTNLNPGQGIYGPRSDKPINVVAWAKGANPVLNPLMDIYTRYKIYSMRWVSSGEFGKTQESRYASHTHAISEASHTHQVQTTLDPSSFEHDHPDVTVKIKDGGAGRSSWITGGKDVLVPGSGGDRSYTGDVGTSSSRWTTGVESNPSDGGGRGIRYSPSSTMTGGFSIATCEASVSYGYSETPGTPFSSRPTDVSTITFDPVDENRPFNVALLPCIKY
jgi:hypothetical protein